MAQIKPESMLMVQRAVSSAKKLGVNLAQGTPNAAEGNCAFESAIFNVNDRDCFSNKLPMSVNYYRKVWMIDMKNRTVNDKTWNIYSKQEWEKGWTDMMESEVYERGIFGDLMLLGIACGLKKVILIFNTSLESPHDPIYVCDPREFGVLPDSEIPIVLAYNLSHYESMHPTGEDDIKKTKELVADYKSGKYTYSKSDLDFLLRSDDIDFPTPSKENEKREPNAEFKNSLPEHLRGKRPRDMDKSERNEYESLRKKFS